jgi:drug/metabolite transporter (DMT)-like permease
VCLGERVTRRFIIALTMGCLGVALIVNPAFATGRWHIVLPLVGAGLWSAYQLLTRLAARYDSVGSTAFVAPLVGLAVLTPVIPWVWLTPSRGDLAVLIIAGAISAAGHYLLIKALELAPASFLQPFSFTVFAWAVIFGFLFFGDRPGLAVVAGGAIVMASAWYAARLPAAS